MCERTRAGALAAALMAALLAAPAGAQQAATAGSAPASGPNVPSEAELVQRIDSLLPLLQQARIERAAAKARAQAELRRAHPPDTFAVGPFTVVAYRSQADEARRLLTAAWAAWAPLVGEAAALLENDVIAYRRAGEPRLSVPAPEGGKAWQVEVWGWEGERAERTAHERVGQAIAARLPHSVRKWMGTGIGYSRESPYRQVVTAGSARAGDCLQGEDADCVAALGLTGGPADWYTGQELATQLRGLRLRAWRGVTEAEQRGCLEHGEAAACARLAGTRRPETLIPIGPGARRALLVEALRTGGDGALARLVAAPADVAPEEALRLASGRSLDTLLARWRAGISAARPERRTGTGQGPLAAVAWIAVFSGIALGRRTWAG